MWKFIRRVFVLLVLFFIIFVIYRYINPVWASNFVEKLKSIPQYISNIFDRWSELIVVDETVSMTWDMNIGIGNDLIKEDESQVNERDVMDEVKEESGDDNTRLEDLNKEIEWILWKSESSTWEADLSWKDQDGLWDDEINNQEETKEIEYIEEWNTWEQNLVEVVNDWKNSISGSDQIVDGKLEEKKWLSDLDYEQIKNVFGNLVD